MNEDRLSIAGVLAWVAGIGVVLVLVGSPIFWWVNGKPEYDRYQARQNAQNQVLINEIIIHQQEQNIQVEKQKAEIRVVEAQGIARAQEIINATLTDKYLTHEAIKVQAEQAAHGGNTTFYYIPSGDNGIPIVKTVDAGGK